MVAGLFAQTKGCAERMPCLARVSSMSRGFIQVGRQLVVDIAGEAIGAEYVDEARKQRHADCS